MMLVRLVTQAECVWRRVQNDDQCHRRKRFQQLVCRKMWCGLPGASVGALSRVLEFLAGFGRNFRSARVFA